jgi:hypothetical protein
MDEDVFYQGVVKTFLDIGEKRCLAQRRGGAENDGK